MNGRVLGASGILILWLGGLGLLARRELSRGASEKLRDASLLVSPGSEFYSVSQRGKQIGFASSGVDTMANGIRLHDLFVADLVADSVVHRASARLIVNATRSLRLKDFLFELGPEMGAIKATGTVSNDSVLTLVVAPYGAKADTQRFTFKPPLLTPNAVPLALVLGDKPKAGHRYGFTVFDPTAMQPASIRLRVLAESTFVVADSAKVDSLRQVWVPMRWDTLKAWHIEPDSGSSSAGMLSGWVDERGRFVRATEFGSFALVRQPYEIAYRNWALARKRGIAVPTVTDDIQETTAIEASAPIANKRSVTLLRVLLRNADLAGFELSGGRQTLTRDTLTIVREAPRTLAAHYTLPDTSAANARYLRAEPLIESDDPQIREVSLRVRSPGDVGKKYRSLDTNPTTVAEALTRWVYRTLDKQVGLRTPDALTALHAKRGDCNEHTALFIALARAAGLPARSAAGLVYVDGKFYFHAWPEVWLDRWVPVDPTFGQFPADASHLRFVTGGWVRQAELLKLVGTLKVDVISAETQNDSSATTFTR